MSNAKNWCFTINNPLFDGDFVKDLLSPLSGYLVFQKEIGASGTPHYQGYVQFTQRRRLPFLKDLFPTAHWEVARGNAAQNKIYCTKEPRLEPYIEFGKPVQKGERVDIEDFRDAILEGTDNLSLVMEFPGQCAKFTRFIDFVRAASFRPRNEKPTVRCYYGDSGTGKTRDATAFMGPEKTFILSRPDSGRPLWWDGYNPTEHLSIVFDDFYGWVPWSYLLQVLDRNAFSVEIKGGKIPLNSPNIFLTSNSHPESWYKNIPNNDLTPLLRRIDEIKKYSV